MRYPKWVSDWHAPLLKLTKAPIVPNRDDTHTLHRLVDDLFTQLQERLASGVDGPRAFRTLLMDVNHFDRAPRGAALASPQTFGVPSALFEFLTFFSSNGSRYRRQRRVACALARYGDGAHTHSFGTTVPEVDADFVPGQISYGGKTV